VYYVVVVVVVALLVLAIDDAGVVIVLLFPLQALVHIAIGSGLGKCCRHFLGGAAAEWSSSFPLGISSRSW
jgi:p-aminobenzoyl-glutamate transporter AbgT